MPALSGISARVAVTQLKEVPKPCRTRTGIEAIFVETSSASRFKGETDREAFRERWLGRYLTHYPDQVFVALTDDNAVVGYLVGCLEDPARIDLFSDISYFADLAHLTRCYPAHLHINLTASWRGLGIGKRLIAAFAAQAAEAGAPGMHVVTREGARNNRFYSACGFRQLASVTWLGNPIAFFGRELAGHRGGAHPNLSQPRSLG